MHLSAVPEIDNETADKLLAAGVPNAEALSIWEDIVGLEERLGVGEGRVEGWRDAARQAVERALQTAGIQGPEMLATAELVPLSDKTRIEIAYLAHYQRKARDSLGKVVLAEAAPIARVHLGEDRHEAVPLVTAGWSDEDDAVLARAGGNAVLLKPSAEVVLAVIGGVTHRALPLYKERRSDDGAIEEVRVRVVEIREVLPGQASETEAPEGEVKEKRGIGRLFSRKK